MDIDSPGLHVFPYDDPFLFFLDFSSVDFLGVAFRTLTPGATLRVESITLPEPSVGLTAGTLGLLLLTRRRRRSGRAQPGRNRFA
jgi:hypothetical protein